MVSHSDPVFDRPAQQAINILPVQGLPDYNKVKVAVIQTLNLNSEAYHRRLGEIEFRPDYHPRLIGQKIKSTCLKWLHPTEDTAKAVCVKHYVALLPYKPKLWVICRQPQTRRHVCHRKLACIPPQKPAATSREGKGVRKAV